MERRKAYIITALIITALITSLSLWYLYLARQEANLNQTTELDYYGGGDASGIGNVFGGSSSFNEQSTAPSSSLTSSPSTTTPGEMPTTGSSTTEQADTPEQWHLTEIYASPVAGASVMQNSTTTVVHIVERKTGNMLEYETSTSETQRVSGVTTPRVSRAIVLDAVRALIIPEDDYARIVTAGSAATTTLLYDPIETVAYDGSEHLYYTSPSAAGVSIRSYNLGSHTTRTIWTSPLHGWGIALVRPGKLLITQAPSRNIPGYAYTLDIQEGTLAPLIRDVPGLMVTLSPDGARTLYSATDTTGTKLFFKHGDTTITLSLATLAHKCAWGSDSTTLYCAVPKSLPVEVPDSWLKGQVHTNDTLWRIDTGTGDAVALAQNTGLDIIDIRESDGVVVFTNKADQTLWGVIRD